MNHKIILLLLITLSSSVFAIDVSSFDIKGIKLGDKIPTVLQILPPIQDRDNKKINGRVFEEHIVTNTKLKEWYHAYFDRNKKLVRFERTVRFDSKFNMDSLKQKFIDKYGQPVLNTEIKEPNFERITWCWGECYINNYGFLFIKSNGVGMTVFMDNDDRSSGYFSLSITLEDNKSNNENKNAMEKAEQQLKKSKQLRNDKKVRELKL